MADKISTPDVTEVTNAPESLEKRKTLMQIWLVMAWTAAACSWLTRDVLAEEVNSDVQLASLEESKAWIDYSEIETPLWAMLSRGEIEFSRNMPSNFDDKKVAKYWKWIVTAVSSWGASNGVLNQIKKFAPDMLIEFSNLDHNNPKFFILSAAGSEFLSEKFAEKS